MIAQATQPPILQDDTSVQVTQLLMSLNSSDVSQTAHISIEKVKYMASWDAAQNYNLNIYPSSAISDYTFS